MDPEVKSLLGYLTFGVLAVWAIVLLIAGLIKWPIIGVPLIVTIGGLAFGFLLWGDR